MREKNGQIRKRISTACVELEIVDPCIGRALRILLRKGEWKGREGERNRKGEEGKRRGGKEGGTERDAIYNPTYFDHSA